MNRVVPVCFQLSLVYAAAAMGMSRFTLAHNSDTVLQALISLLRWTPYYWGENRFGMLVPLLARPFADPATNLIFQTVLIAWSGLLAIWFLTRLTENPAASAAATGLIFAIVLMLFKERAALLLILQSTYLTPVALLMGGWFAFTRQEWPVTLRTGALAIALLLSFWINVANVVFALVLAMLWPGFRRRDRIIALSTVIATNAGMTFLASLVPGNGFRDLLPADQWGDALNHLLQKAAEDVVNMPSLIALLITGGILLAVQRRWDARCALALAAVAQICVVSMSEWVARNSSDARYILPPLFILGVLAAGTVGYPIAESMRKLQSPAITWGLASLIVVAAATRVFGFPSPSAAVHYLEAATAPAAKGFSNGDCTHLIGDYWRVWMAVYHDMLNGRTPPRNAVTFRSDVIQPLWDHTKRDKRTYCSACADQTLEYYRILRGLPPLKLAMRDADTCHWTSP